MPRPSMADRRLTLVAAAVLTMAACSGSASSAKHGGNQLEGEVDIIAWPGYIERGASDKQYDWVTPFERSTGCKVNVKTAANSDEMVSLMTRGGYDLVTASGDATLRLLSSGVVQPIDLKRVTRYGTVDQRLQEAPWHFINGRHYGVPFQWGPNVLLYSTRVFKKAPSSWSVVFEGGNLPDGKPAKGRVQAYDGPIYIANAALYLMAHAPDLGIKDPYELNETQYAMALALLRHQRPLVQRYWHDSNVQVQDFTNAGVAVSDSWPLQVNTLIANQQPVASTIPSEGATAWADTTMLHAAAKHPNCAYKWLDWSLTPKVQGDVAAWFGSVPVVPAACANNALLGANGCKTNGAGQFDRLHFWRTPVAQCASQGSCVPYSRWSTDYLAVMAGH